MKEKTKIPAAPGNCFGRLAEVNQFFARFDPIAMLQDESWVRVDERRRRYPRSGGVRVPSNDLNGNTSVGAFWFLPHEPSISDDGQVATEGPVRAIPVLDFRHLSMAEIRKKIFKDGVKLPDHQTRQAIVLLPGAMYGRFKFERVGAHWLGRQSNDGIVEFWPVDPTWRAYAHSDEFSYLPNRPELTAPTECVDWTPDADFLSKVLGRYKAAVDAYFALSTKGSDDPAKRLHRALADARLLGDDAKIHEGSIKRLREDLSSSLDSFESIRELGEVLLNSEAGKLLLQRTIEAKTRSIVAEIEVRARTDVEALLSGKRGESQQLDDQIRRLKVEEQALEKSSKTARKLAADSEATLKSLAMEIAAQSQAIDAALLTLSQVEENRTAAEAAAAKAMADESAARLRADQINSELHRLSARLLDAFEESNLAGDERLSDLGRRVGALLSSSGAEMAPLSVQSAPWWLPVGESPHPIDIDDLPRRIGEEAAFFGVDSQDLRLLVGALRAGEIVLLVGSAAELALQAAAHATAGGQVRTHALDPSAIGLDDIWRVPGSHRPTSFAMAWNRALQEPETIVLVCLRNLDTAPFRLWLQSLRAAMDSPRRPLNLWVVATAVGRSEGEDDFPDATALRRNLFALQPRFSDGSHRSDYALATQPGHASMLTLSQASRQLRIAAPPAELRKVAHEPVVVHRALKLKAALEEPQATATAVSWANFLTSANLEDLQGPLRDGYDGLKNLHLQR